VLLSLLRVRKQLIFFRRTEDGGEDQEAAVDRKVMENKISGGGELGALGFRKTATAYSLDKERRGYHNKEMRQGGKTKNDHCNSGCNTASRDTHGGGV